MCGWYTHVCAVHTPTHTHTRTHVYTYILDVCRVKWLGYKVNKCFVSGGGRLWGGSEHSEMRLSH